jgi:nicotinamide-nucleotide amidase
MSQVVPNSGAEISAALHHALEARRATVACAESLTGGELASLLSGTPGASSTFVGGVVSYATEVKRDLLGVTADRVVSADCAAEMARGVQALMQVDWALSTTGVAGPDEQEHQPVGTVFIGVAGPRGVSYAQLALEGDRAEIRTAACVAAVDLLLSEVTRG